jgi:hypothetical protein
VGSRTVVATTQEDCNGGTHNMRHRLASGLTIRLSPSGGSFGSGNTGVEGKDKLDLSCLASHGTVGWPFGATVALTRGTA